MKRVYLRGRGGGGPSHSLYRELTKSPPDGYQFVTGNPEPVDRQRLVFNLNKRLESIPYARDVWREARTLQYMALRSAQSMGTKSKVSSDLVYASQQLIFDKMPWVVDFEYANALVDYGDIRLCRRFVHKALTSKYCRKIMPWSDWAKRTLYRSLDCDTFKEKIETVHFAVNPKVFTKEKNSDKVRFLFVGSTNVFNFLNFEWKGGFEVMEAFLELSKRYKGLELVMRSWVPAEIRERCVGKSNIKIFSSPLSEEALVHLYASSDIFLFPSYLNLGIAILEAMSYELPVVALDLYDVSEAIRDMKTGILLDPPPTTPCYTWNGAPNHYDSDFLRKIRQLRQPMVNQIVDKSSLLIEEDSLRSKIGRNARKLVEQGEFSVKRRNEKLKRIFDEATRVD